MDNILARFERIARRTLKFAEAGVEDDVPQLHPFEARNIHSEIIKISQKLFDDGYCSQATFEAYKYIDRVIQKISSTNESGYKLIMKVFDEQNADYRRINLTECKSKSESDEQQGYKFLFAGSTLAIRNPRGHEKVYDDPDTCLDHLSLASALLRRIEKAGYKIPSK